jgi:hypothetical protein
MRLLTGVFAAAGIALGLSVQAAGTALTALGVVRARWFDRAAEKLAIPPRAAWQEQHLLRDVWRRLRGRTGT